MFAWLTPYISYFKVKAQAESESWNPGNEAAAVLTDPKSRSLVYLIAALLVLLAVVYFKGKK
jgi:hypothetical protein